jgi:hypothetical protein
MTEDLNQLVDKDHWHPNDTQWLAERKVAWPDVEDRLLVLGKKRKEINVVKRYYLYGEMPDWLKLQDDNADENHVDLYTFLWLHPSWDMNVLEPLRDAYVNYEPARAMRFWPVFQPIALGVNTACAAGSHRLSLDGKSIVMHAEGHFNELFDLCIGRGCRKEFLHFLLKERPWDQVYNQITFGHLISLAEWLMIGRELNACNRDMLFQYEQPIEAWYYAVNALPNYFLDKKVESAKKSAIATALWRIFHFDLEQEGDTIRSRCLVKWRKLLKERSFESPEFNEVLDIVLNDELRIYNPWKGNVQVANFKKKWS